MKRRFSRKFLRIDLQKMQKPAVCQKWIWGREACMRPAPQKVPFKKQEMLYGAITLWTLSALCCLFFNNFPSHCLDVLLIFSPFKHLKRLFPVEIRRSICFCYYAFKKMMLFLSGNNIYWRVGKNSYKKIPCRLFPFSTFPNFLPSSSIFLFSCACYNFVGKSKTHLSLPKTMS